MAGGSCGSHSLSVCPSQTCGHSLLLTAPTGPLSPPVGGVRFVASGSALRSGKESTFAQLELAGVGVGVAGRGEQQLLRDGSFPLPCAQVLGAVGSGLVI